MTTNAIDYLVNLDMTVFYAVLVWIGAFLTVTWAILMRADPANGPDRVHHVDLRLHRWGILIMLAGFLASVLLGGRQAWAPWPTMLIVIFGFDFYIAVSIFTVVRRAKVWGNGERLKQLLTGPGTHIG